MNRLSTARGIEQADNFCIIEEVYGKGIVMWFLSQGSNIEVLKLEVLRQEMKLILQNVLERY